jgi:type IX secretion system PorP/SprF family membrane protein
MKKLLNLALIIFLVSTSYAQRDPQYSFNMFNHMAVNPGFAGASGGICARGIFHEQWIGFDDAPNTIVFSGDMALNNINSGVGLNILQDRSGYNKNLYLNGNYSYRLKIGDDGDLGIGLGLGLLQNAISGEWVTPDQLSNPNASHNDDGLIPQQESHIKFDANLGAFYHTTFDKYNEMYAGVSITHLTQPTFTTDAGGEGNYYPRTYYFTAGYYYTMPNGLIQLRPSVFLKTEFVSTQVSFNLTALYNQMFWAGITYRAANDLGLMVGATLQNNLSFGIAYDYHMTNELQTVGSIDVMLKYCFSLTKKGGKTSYKSVRFL